jgi:hypothetical protein
LHGLIDLKQLYHLAVPELSLADQLENYLVAVTLLRLLQNMQFFPDRGDKSQLSDDEVYIGLLLAHFLLVGRSNSQTISQTTDYNRRSTAASLSQFSPTVIGCGVYPTLALFNHSCVPNVVKIQQGRRTVLIAGRPIRAGEEVLDSYGPLAYTSPRSVRLRQLGFSCACIPCIRDWSQVFICPSSILNYCA